MKEGKEIETMPMLWRFECLVCEWTLISVLMDLQGIKPHIWSRAISNKVVSE